MDRVVIEAPASSANLGPGFDVFAIALKRPFDAVEASADGGGRPSVTLELVGDKRVPAALRKNSAGAVVISMVKRFGLRGEINLRLRKNVPVGVGLGSSGASSAAAAVAMDRLFGLKMTAAQLVRQAGVGEKVASGATHLDNVAAAVMGGFVIVPQGSGASPARFKAPPPLRVVVATPKVKLPEKKTEYARSLLPSSVPLAELVWNVSRASMIVSGFAKGDVSMIGEGMEDAVIEPARARLVPGLRRVKAAAKGAGASGVCISGAGPSVISLVDREKADPRAVLGAMLDSFEKKGIEAGGFVSSVGEGARVVEGS